MECKTFSGKHDVYVCFISLTIGIYGGFQKDADVYAPYDMCYAGLYGYKQISPDETAALLEKEQVRVDAVYQLNFFQDHVYNYVSVSEVNTNYWQGTINLFTFNDWRHSKNGVVSVQNYLQKQNNLTEAEQKAVAVSSKIGDDERASQSGSVLWLFMSFVVVLLLSAILISIHFRIIGEKDENAKRANSLYYLGCMKKELCEILLFKIVCVL